MKNLLNAIALSFLLSFPIMSLTQIIIYPIPSIKYGDNPKLHARGITADRKKIYIAASDSRLYIYNNKTKGIDVQEFPINAELRDIEISRKHIVLLASGDSSSTISINRKTNQVKINQYPDLFLDGISINKNDVFIMGDPVDDSFSLFHSENSGNSWEVVDSVPRSIQGEAGFAASGTNVQMTSKEDWYFVSGGLDSRLYQTHDAGLSWTDSDMGFKSCASCGAYSFVILPDNKTIIAVGGDYTDPKEGTGACRISNDCGKTWHSPKNDLFGYRSCIIYYKGDLFACGTNGIDVSSDFGESWTQFTTNNYFALTIFQKQLIATTTNGMLHVFDVKKNHKPPRKPRE